MEESPGNWENGVDDSDEDSEDDSEDDMNINIEEYFPKLDLFSHSDSEVANLKDKRHLAFRVWDAER